MAMQTGTDSAGGYATPSDLDKNIFEIVRENSVAQRLARNVTMTSDKYRCAFIQGGVQVNEVAETVMVPDSDMTLSETVLTATKLMSRTILSSELYEDAVDWDSLEGSVGSAVAFAVDQYFFETVGAAIIASNIVTASGAIGTTVWDDIAAVTALVPAAAEETPAWVMSRKAYGDLAVRLEGAAGFRTFDGLPMGSLAGHPVWFADSIPFSGAGANVALFGNWYVSTVLGYRRTPQVRLLTQGAAAANGQVELMGMTRVGAGLHDDTSVAALAVTS